MVNRFGENAVRTASGPTTVATGAHLAAGFRRPMIGKTSGLVVSAEEAGFGGAREADER